MDDQCLSEAKTDRVLAIYSRLVGGAVLNKADLAQQFHVTQRSIQRDIAFVCKGQLAFSSNFM